MEYLETKSVPVAGYKTSEMPAYMAVKSGIKLPCQIDSVNEAAKAFKNMIIGNAALAAKLSVELKNENK